MSRSYLHDEYMKNQFDGTSGWFSRKTKKYKNKHRQDEAPKNRPSKYITSRCGNVEWLQEPSNFCGHKPHKEGHRMVSGIVRAKVKHEITAQINDELNND